MLEYQLTERLVHKFNLQEEHQDMMRAKIAAKEVHTLSLRQFLCEQNQPLRNAFYLLRGNVTLSVKIHQEDIVISEVGEGEIVNLEVVVNSWRCKYSIICATSEVAFLTLTESEVVLLAEQSLPHIRSVMAFRDEAIKSKSTKHHHRSSLPNIILEKHLAKPVRFASQSSTKDYFPSSNLLSNAGTLSMKRHHGKTKSDMDLQTLKKQSQKQIPNTYELLRLKDFNLRTVERSPKYQKTQVVVDYLMRRNNRKKEAVPKQNIRSDKLFKEQLKHIVERKMKYQRKHFKVLKQHQPDRVREEKSIHIHEIQEQQIDNYFEI